MRNVPACLPHTEREAVEEESDLITLMKCWSVMAQLNRHSRNHVHRTATANPASTYYRLKSLEMLPLDKHAPTLAQRLAAAQGDQPSSSVRILNTGIATSGLTSLIAADRADGGLFAAQSFCGVHKGVLVSKQLSTTGGCHFRITSCHKRDRGTRSIATMELLRSSSISAQIKLALCGK